jgi:HD-GYP domain-containing protein (c-di-GMP phosphodiesterase class II)
MEKIVHVRHLRPGVFVSRLDRPWLGTPFLLQGFRLASWQEVEELSRCCSYVYIDPEYGDDLPEAVDPARHIEEISAAIRSAALSHPLSAAYPVKFENEIGPATDLHRHATQFITGLLEDVRVGGSVNFAGAREVVEEMTQSVLRNPDALLLINQLRETDEYTALHSVRACVLMLAFGRYLGLQRPDLEALGLGGLLHDVGKMRVPAEILNKPGPLTEAEFEAMKAHVVEGVLLLEAVGNIPPGAIEVARCHHERYDGSGYPRGLRGWEAVGLFGLIAGIVDVYDAVTIDRVYGQATTPYEALRYIYQQGGSHFDQDLALRFIQCIGIYPVGSCVQMNTGHVGLVISVHPNHRLKPTVLIILDANGQRYAVPVVIDLLTQGVAAQSAPLEVRSVVSPAQHGIDVRRHVAQAASLTRSAPLH